MAKAKKKVAKKVAAKKVVKKAKPAKVVKKKEKAKPVDGLGIYEKTKLRNAIRQIWQRSKARQLVIKRCTGKDGFLRCEECKAKTPKIQVDHIKPAGELDGGFIERLFVPSDKMRGLCKTCHAPKTKAENAERRARKQKTMVAGIDYACPEDELESFGVVTQNEPVLDSDDVGESWP